MLMAAARWRVLARSVYPGQEARREHEMVQDGDGLAFTVHGRVCAAHHLTERNPSRA